MKIAWFASLAIISFDNNLFHFGGYSKNSLTQGQTRNYVIAASENDMESKFEFSDLDLVWFAISKCPTAIFSLLRNCSL